MGLSESELTVLRNGWERPHEGESNAVQIPDGGEFTLELASPAKKLRLALDPDFSRKSITDDPRYEKFAMRSHVMLCEKPLSMPEHLLRSAEIVFILRDGRRETVTVSQNRAPRLLFEIPDGTLRIEIGKLRSFGGESVGLFACELI